MPFWNKKATHDERVHVYDPDTNAFSTIPAAELAPGMVRITLTGMEGEFWADAAKLKPSDYKHPPFSEQIRQILRDIMVKLADVYPLSLQRWEDGFRRDTNAEREIAFWVHIANIYAQVTANRVLALEHNREIFSVILSCANNPREHVLTVVDLQEMSRQEADAIMTIFYQDGHPSDK